MSSNELVDLVEDLLEPEYSGNLKKNKLNRVLHYSLIVLLTFTIVLLNIVVYFKIQNTLHKKQFREFFILNNYLRLFNYTDSSNMNV